MNRRFPQRVHLDNYTAQDIAQIVCNTARSKYSFEFENDDLQGMITEWCVRCITQPPSDCMFCFCLHSVEEQHVLRLEEENASLAIGMLADAVRCRAMRKKAERKTPGVETFDGLIKEDFGLDEKPLDRFEEQKEQLQRDMDALVGLEAGKIWFNKMKLKIEHEQRVKDPKMGQKGYSMVPEHGVHTHTPKPRVHAGDNGRSWHRKDNSGEAHSSFLVPSSVC
jgi:hypothetical protein